MDGQSMAFYNIMYNRRLTAVLHMFNFDWK